MTFGEKIKELRKKAGLTQRALGEKIGVSTRTVSSYESGQSYPKSRETYEKMAEVFQVSTNYLLIENEEEEMAERWEKEDGRAQAEALIQQAQAMFSGGKLSSRDKDAVMKALEDAYWDGRREKIQ